MSNKLPENVKRSLKNNDSIAVQALPEYAILGDIEDENIERALPDGTELEEFDGDELDPKKVNPSNMNFKYLDIDNIKFPKSISGIYSFTTHILSFTTTLIIALFVLISILTYGDYIYLSGTSDMYNILNMINSYYVYAYFAISLSLAGAISTVIWYILGSPPAIRNETKITTGFFTAFLIGAAFHLLAGIGGPITYLVVALALLAGLLIPLISIPVGLLSGDVDVVVNSVVIWVITVLFAYLLSVISSLGIEIEIGVVQTIYLFTIGMISLVPVATMGVISNRLKLGEKLGENEYLYQIFLEYIQEFSGEELKRGSDDGKKSDIYKVQLEEARSDIVSGIGLMNNFDSISHNLIEIEEHLKQDDYDEADEKLAELNETICLINNKELDDNSIIYNTKVKKKIEEITQKFNKEFNDVKKRLDEKRELRRSLEQDLAPISSELDKANNHIINDRFEEADKILLKTESELSAVSEKMEASQFHFDYLSDLLSEYEQRRSSLSSKLDEYVESYQNIVDQVDSIQSELNNISAVINREKLDVAEEVESSLQSQITSAEFWADTYAFQDLEEKIKKIKKGRYKKLVDNIERKKRQLERQQLQTKLKSLHSKLEHISAVIEEGNVDRAEKKLKEVEVDTERAKKTADKYEFNDLQSNLTSIQSDIERQLKQSKRQQAQTELESLHSELDHVSAIIAEGDFDKAKEKLKELETDTEKTKETADEYEFKDLQNNLTSIQSDIERQYKENKRQQLQTELESIRSNITKINTANRRDNLEEYQDKLEDLKYDIKIARETATQHDFDDLYHEFLSIEQTRKNCLKDVIKRLKSTPVPDTIPKEPYISVDYGALTNKESIGGGGNADVTKATLPKPDGGVTLAIKEPRMSGTLHTDAVRRMLEEAETWDMLSDHDHIVGVVDYGSKPIPWIAMEYMDGSHLGAQSGQMDIPQALWTAIAITKGVRHAHRRGVAHLDLKPENILFRIVGDTWDVPKVADWGLSKHLLEHSKSVEGLSPQYAAPEQFDEDFGSADDVTDIYQLGAVFYELFTGRPPFEGNPAKAMHKVLHEKPTPPSEIADIPEALDEILLRALAKEKDDRYESVLLLRNDLQDLYDEY
jgi:hypothetical protein